MDAPIFPDQHLIDFVKAAYSGGNAPLFIALNVLALYLYRNYGVRWAFAVAATIASGMGALAALIETEAKIGTSERAAPVLLHAVLAGGAVAAASSLVVGYGILVILERLKLGRLPANGANGANGHTPPATPGAAGKPPPVKGAKP